MSNIMIQINEITNFIRSFTQEKLDIGLILGSGLNGLADNIEDKIVIPYENIPYLPNSTAPGHSGNLILGKIKGKMFITMQGRFHLYESWTPVQATLLIRVMKKLGVKTLIITCAAGGLNHSFTAGDIMLITDHINFSGHSPLVGENLPEFGPRFPIMFDIYTHSLRKITIDASLDAKIAIKQGIYASVLGPNYATRAELDFLIKSNCSAIGMSVVQEAIVAAHSNMQILALAAITDMALPYGANHATEDEIIKSGQKIERKFRELLIRIADKV